MAPSRVPQASDFPSHITLSITPSASSSSPTPPNVLLLLHGLGDTHTSLTSLGAAMNLPETLCISLRAPSPLPFEAGSTGSASGPGYHWGDDIVFDPGKPDGGIEVEGCGYSKAVECVDEVMGALREKCGYVDREVLVMGLGQGGGVGLAYAVKVAREGQQELGGVMSLGGALPTEFRRGASAGTSSTGGKSKTPVLVCHGKSGSAVTVSKVKEIREAFEFVEVKQWDRQGDGMARNKAEMMPIMQFFGRRLRSRAGVPEGAVEVG